MLIFFYLSQKLTTFLLKVNILKMESTLGCTRKITDKAKLYAFEQIYWDCNIIKKAIFLKWETMEPKIENQINFLLVVLKRSEQLTGWVVNFIHYNFERKTIILADFHQFQLTIQHSLPCNNLFVLFSSVCQKPKFKRELWSLFLITYTSWHFLFLIKYFRYRYEILNNKIK